VWCVCVYGGFGGVVCVCVLCVVWVGVGVGVWCVCGGGGGGGGGGCSHDAQACLGKHLREAPTHSLE